MTSYPVIVKEVGQGMGPESLRALLELPLEALEMAAYGGTNFARVELMRSDPFKHKYYEPISKIGHDALEMTDMINKLVNDHSTIKCKQIIISGGVGSFLDGFYLINRSKIPAVYGQASEFLKFAAKSYKELKRFVEYQIEGIKLANAYFVIKESQR
jgi:isopentenyl-diphosphate delta-isomerase